MVDLLFSSTPSRPRWRTDGQTDVRFFSFLFSFISSHHTLREYILAPRSRAAARAHAHTIDGSRRIRVASLLRERERERETPSSLTTYFNRLARRGRSATASAISRRRERRRISIPPLFPSIVMSVYPLSIMRRGNWNGDSSIRQPVEVRVAILSAASSLNSLNSCLVSLVSSASALRLQRGSYSLPHGLIDAPTAPLTTPSLRRRVSVHSTGATNAERTPKGENIIRLFRLRVASRRVASRRAVGRRGRRRQQTQQSRARRCSAWWSISCGGEPRARDLRSKCSSDHGGEQNDEGGRAIDVYRRECHSKRAGGTTVILWFTLLSRERALNPAGHQPGRPRMLIAHQKCHSVF